jgi:hypothetical protein
MTSNDRWTEMADFDAELERLLSGGSPSAEAPAWFGDVAVLVRTARAPARPDELAGEADIVARMVQVRLAVLAEAEAEVGADDGGDGATPTVSGVNGHRHHNGTSLSDDGKSGSDEPARNGTALSAGGESGGSDEGTRTGVSFGSHAKADSDSDEDTRNGTRLSADGGTAEGARNGTSVGAYAEADGEAGSEALEDRLRERVALSDLDEYRAKHGGERSYVAKHAAPPPDEPPHAVARTVGRVIAMKAVAVTTAAVIGVAAAAAATTGIVANVVVPAINDHYRRPVPTSELQDEQKDEDDEPGTSRSTRNPSHVPTPRVSVDPAPGVPPLSPSTTTPAPTSSSVPADTTSSTTASTTTTTSEPEPSSTSTPTTVAADPQPPSP